MAMDARGSLSPRSLGVKPPVEGDTVVPTSLIPVSTNGRGLLQPEGRGPWSAIWFWPGPHLLSAGFSPVLEAEAVREEALVSPT